MNKEYICPMHPTIESEKPGKCPKCGMRLVLKSSLEKQNHYLAEKGLEKMSYKNYIPLAVIIGLILMTSVVVSFPLFNLRQIISSFMAGFFIVFAGFKLIDLGGFAEGYSTYDLLAKKWFFYGYIYPFIELSLGFLMILGMWMSQVLLFEILVMTFSGVGVLLKILKGERFQCMCLGTFLKVPLTKITLVEDFGMVLLGLILLTNIIH
ncbi:MAG TPA: heavy metal-binding domain-containing protein [Patescibacteria group bacterium]|nr:heavy metal-binding domain-containing protein [Patescibacteria group bacterium]